MRLTTLLSVTTLVLISSVGYGQITLKLKDASLEKVLTSIEKQTKYVFLYDPDELKMSPITISVKNATLQQTLGKIFKGLPVEFTLVGNNVLLKMRRSGRLESDMIADVMISGKIVDDSGRPMQRYSNSRIIRPKIYDHAASGRTNMP